MTGSGGRPSASRGGSSSGGGVNSSYQRGGRGDSYRSAAARGASGGGYQQNGGRGGRGGTGDVAGSGVFYLLRMLSYENKNAIFNTLYNTRYSVSGTSIV